MTLRIAFPLIPPAPTKEDPYCQLDWVVHIFVRRYKNPHTRKSHLNTLAAYKNFLKACNGYDSRLETDHRYLLKIHCDQLALYNAAEYWREKQLSPHTINGRIYSLRSLFTFAAEQKLSAVDSFFVPNYGRPFRSTSIRTAYDDEEFQAIVRTFGPTFEYAKRIAAGYQVTHIAKAKYWASWEKIVWYFENEMACTATPCTRQTRLKHRSFFHACSLHHGGLNEVYRRLGVSSLIDIDLIAPLAMKLSWETGLNPESLLTLKRDCFSPSHPLFGSPYLSYFKARSSGAKELYLSLFDDRATNGALLQRKQSVVISKTIELILKLTEPLLDRCKPEDREYLFLYEAWANVPGKPFRHPVRLNVRYFYQWSHMARRRLEKAGENKLPNVWNLGRFRPTKLLQMVRAGKDFFDVQSVAGHVDPLTTLLYLASHQITPQALREVSAALVRIHANAEEFKLNPKPYAGAEIRASTTSVIYKTPLCDCKDVYSPPQSVRQLPSYREGQACTYFNMCLLCPNVLIIKKHLPQLIRYAQEIKSSLSLNAADAPNTPHYERALAVIQGILHEFSEADLTWAAELAEDADCYTDPYTHRSVIQEKN